MGPNCKTYMKIVVYTKRFAITHLKMIKISLTVVNCRSLQREKLNSELLLTTVGGIEGHFQGVPLGWHSF